LTRQETERDAVRATSLKLVGIRTVCDLTSLSRATIYRLVDSDRFPRGLKITANRVAWREQAVLDWLASRQVSIADRPVNARPNLSAGEKRP